MGGGEGGGGGGGRRGALPGVTFAGSQYPLNSQFFLSVNLSATHRQPDRQINKEKYTGDF